MKSIHLIITLLTLFSAQAQIKHTIKDSVSNTALAYANVKFLEHNDGVYSNEYGEFSLPEELHLNDSIEISYVGYYQLKMLVKDLKDTIYLQPKEELLNEVIITNKKPNLHTFGLLDKKSNLTWHISPKLELTTLIQLKNHTKDYYVSEIKIPISKSTLKNIDGKLQEVKPSFSSVFKVHLYYPSDNKPSYDEVISPIIIECNQDTNDIITIDVTDKLIKFPKEGIFIGIEMIGSKDENDKIINDNSLPSFKFTNKKERNIESVSFYKNPFIENEWIQIDEYGQFSFLGKNYNMTIGLSLVTYED